MSNYFHKVRSDSIISKSLMLVSEKLMYMTLYFLEEFNINF